MLSLSPGFCKLLASASAEQQASFTDALRQPIPLAPFTFTAMGRLRHPEFERDPVKLCEQLNTRRDIRADGSAWAAEVTDGASVNPMHLKYMYTDNAFVPGVVSRLQCIVRRQLVEGAVQYTIKDPVSTSGVWLDGQKIAVNQWHPLQEGARVRFQQPSLAVRGFLDECHRMGAANAALEPLPDFPAQALLPRDLHAEFVFSRLMSHPAMVRASRATAAPALVFRSDVIALDFSRLAAAAAAAAPAPALAPAAAAAAEKGQKLRCAVATLTYHESKRKEADAQVEKITGRKRALDEQWAEKVAKKNKTAAAAAAGSCTELDPDELKAKMMQEYTCSMCTDLMDQASILDCGHSGCKECLETWFITKREKSCPECRAVHKGAPASVRASDNMIALLVAQYFTPEEKQAREEKISKRESAETTAAMQKEQRRLAQAIGAQKKAAREVELANNALKAIAED